MTGVKEVMMKIKFIKEYVSVDPATNSGIIHRFGEIEEIQDYTAEWLIDNGFAEGVEESWPCYGHKYWYVNADGTVVHIKWADDAFEIGLKAIGNVFKTKELAQAYADYLKAITTVRQDKGFMRKSDGGFGWPVIEFTANNPGVDDIVESRHAGEFYFDTREHALDSAMNHTRECKTILDYDWSRE